MTRQRIAWGTAAALAALTFSVPAFAHVGVPGHEHSGFAAGLAHPVGGLDHLLAMLSVGIWSALAAKGDGRKVWLAPVAFVAAMLAGALAGYTGIALPLVETGIALSVALLGVMIVARLELSRAAGAGLIALFAVYHGHAHGAEAAGSIAAYMAGFAVVTASLHFGGIVLGTALLRVRHATCVVGSLVAAAGTYLLTAT